MTFDSAPENADFKLLPEEWKNRCTVASLLSGLGAVLQKIYSFVQYTPLKCFNNFAQSTVNARKKGDGKRISSVLAETMKLQANSSYVYQTGADIQSQSTSVIKNAWSNQ